MKTLKRGYRISRYVIYRETLLEPIELWWSFIGSFVGIGILGFIQSKFLLQSDSLLLIGSFGASSVLIYGAVQSPLAQPRNLIGGHIISSIVGVTVNLLFSDIFWLACALAVSLSIVAMHITKTLHPPGGATALIAIIGSESILKLGFAYVIYPVAIGSLILLFIALIFNNLTKNRKYPTDGRFSRTIEWVIKPAKSGYKKLKNNIKWK